MRPDRSIHEGYLCRHCAVRFLGEDVSYCSLSRTRLKFSLLILHRKVLRSHATYRYSYYKVLYLIAAQGIFLAASQRKIRCFFGSGAYSCRCANGVRVTPDDKRYCAAPPGSTAARRHLYGTKMSEYAAPYGGKSSATANTPTHRAIENGDTPHTAINGTPYIRLYSGKIYVPCRAPTMRAYIDTTSHDVKKHETARRENPA